MRILLYALLCVTTFLLMRKLLASSVAIRERQRIAIARAALKNAPILILDEATSALDSVTERLIQDSFHEIMKDRTTLVIAHRLSTLQDMDRILVFDKGRLVEDGSCDILLANKDGAFYKLWQLQNEGFLPEKA